MQNLQFKGSKELTKINLSIVRYVWITMPQKNKTINTVYLEKKSRLTAKLLSTL